MKYHTTLLRLGSLGFTCIFLLIPCMSTTSKQESSPPLPVSDVPLISVDAVYTDLIASGNTVTITTEGNRHYIPLHMYYQTDPQWNENFLYGDTDHMTTHGCGPTALAILISSLTDTQLSPVDAAVWAHNNHQHAPSSGSYHSIIPDGAAAYNLNVDYLSTLDFEQLKVRLNEGQLIALLMGPGDFSDSGHFVVIYGYTDDNQILIADPASEQRTASAWDSKLVESQLSTSAQANGPIWVISNP